jgi:hypothetical protein
VGSLRCPARWSDSRAYRTSAGERRDAVAHHRHELATGAVPVEQRDHHCQRASREQVVLALAEQHDSILINRLDPQVGLDPRGQLQDVAHTGEAHTR